MRDELYDEWYRDYLRQETERILDKVSKLADRLYDHHEVIPNWQEVEEEFDMIQVDLVQLLEKMY